MQQNKKLEDSLLLKAVGCTTAEVVEEYALNNEDGNLQLVKKKVTTKQLPPDIDAAKTLIEFYGDDSSKYASFSDEELINEKNKLLELLQKTKEEENGSFEGEQKD